MDGSSDPRDIYNLFFGSDAVEEEAREEKAFAFAASSMATYVNSDLVEHVWMFRRMPGDNEDVIEEQVDEDDTDDENPNEGAGDEDDDDD
ncbi:hypothetical protein QVD17_37143 [Tagetes erecta]|uniref:Uncharacterized protein n=1 Tax=Tagetes erecta TaxID=13708 RepID=A0AAD8JXN2_TARER|nr:hypothetical protein QVD17_37143 [Tagetes erecta]